MQFIGKIILASLFGVLASVSAHALSLTPASTPVWTGPNNANMNASQIDAFLLTQGRDVNGTLTEAYTQNVGGSETGSFASSYVTTFNNTPSDPADALIDYISGPSITGGEIYLYVKNGRHDPAFYIFDISGWNGTDDINLTGFWPQQGAIAHVTVLRTAGSPPPPPPPPPGVPDSGTTLALFGIALGTLGAARRKFAV